eukprot:4088694-Pyramimonas_sp.AAC.1
MEVFSPPRIAPEVEKRGGRLGSSASFDRLTGWDSGIKEHVRHLWREIKKNDPETIWLSSECKVFSAINRINRDRRDPQRWHQQ